MCTGLETSVNLLTDTGLKLKLEEETWTELSFRQHSFPEVNHPLTVALHTVTVHLKLNYYTDQSKGILHHFALQENNEMYPQWFVEAFILISGCYINGHNHFHKAALGSIENYLCSIAYWRFFVLWLNKSNSNILQHLSFFFWNPEMFPGFHLIHMDSTCD